MKNIKLITLISLLLGTFCNSQVDNTYSLFTGTWYHLDTSTNQKFIVDFWVDGDELLGHYKLVQLNSNGNQVSEIYNSDKEITAGYNWPYALYGRHNNINIGKKRSTGGVIIDNTVIWGSNNAIYAQFTMDIEQELSNIENCINCTITARFTTKKGQGLGIQGEPDLNVPRDIILTKE